MTTFLFLTIASVVIPSADDDKVKQELKKLEGTWKIVKAEGGEETKTDKKRAVIIKGSKIDFGDTTDGLEFAIDPSKDPKWFDLKLPFSEKVVETLPGIYRLDENKLTICWVGSYSSKTGPVRPKEFKAQKTEGGDTFVIYLEREKQK